MEKAYIGDLRSIPRALVLWIVSAAFLMTLSAFICYMSGNPLGFTGLAAKISLFVSAFFAGCAVRRFHGAVMHGIICSLIICATILLISMTGEITGENIIILCIMLPVSMAGYLAASLISGRKKRRSRRRR